MEQNISANKNKIYPCNGLLCNGKLHIYEEMSISKKSKCKKCVSEYMKLYFKHFRDHKNIHKYNNPCSKCSCCDIRLLEFDHVGMKNFNISHSFSKIKISKEIKNTQVLCIWCHRIKSYKNHNSISFKTKIPSYEVSQDSPGAILCNGPVCKGKFKHKSNFYIRKNINTYRKTCKICVAFSNWEQMKKKKDYIISWKLKISKCQYCYRIVDENNHFCFDFDHIDQNSKLMEVSKMVSYKSSIENIDKEISKCQLLCCYCHRIKTFTQLSHTYEFVFNDKLIRIPIKKCSKCNNDTGNSDNPLCINCSRFFNSETPKQIEKVTIKCLKCNIYMSQKTDSNMCSYCETYKEPTADINLNKCQDCDTPISKYSKMCSSCQKKSCRRVERPSLEILTNEVTSYGYSFVGRKYGVSGNAVKKWFKFYKVQPPKIDRSKIYNNKLFIN